MLSFKELSLNEAILVNLEKVGYSTPTDIQARAIPLLLEGHDLLGIAQTGTGKTAAFTLPIIHQLLKSEEVRLTGQPRALILAPTRELASQILESVLTYASDLDLKACALYGGVGQK